VAIGSTGTRYDDYEYRASRPVVDNETAVERPDDHLAAVSMTHLADDPTSR
jgi:hypothetical protein